MGGGRPYVAIATFGGGWEWECVRARGGAGNKGFARRPQEFLGWEEGEWEGMGYGCTRYVGMEV